MAEKNFLAGKTHGIRNFFKTQGFFLGSSSEFPDSNDTGYCNICYEIFEFYKVSFAYENCHTFLKLVQEDVQLARGNQGKYRKFVSRI